MLFLETTYKRNRTLVTFRFFDLLKLFHLEMKISLYSFSENFFVFRFYSTWRRHVSELFLIYENCDLELLYLE